MPENNANPNMTVEIIEVSDLDYDSVETFDAFPALGVSNDDLQHALLNGRELADQHPITAITGLQESLDEITSLKPIYSDKIGVASYYKWYDGAHDESGYFVSMVPHTSTIAVCEGSDIFGVTVSTAGFVGNEGYIEEINKDGTTRKVREPRDNTYAIVATTGIVDVRCASDVVDGDYVISDKHGIAIKTTSNCGYKVFAIEDKDGVPYASISLGVQACVTDALGQKVKHLTTRMDDAEINIAAAMNVATEAYNKSAALAYEALDSASDAANKADDVMSKVEEVEGAVNSANSTATTAKTIAEAAVVTAETAADEAYKTANEALAKVGENTDEFVQLRASVDKYSVGDYSQAYGLTLNQARNILKDGMIYIPTKHGEALTHTETYPDDTNYSFTYGFYYVWTTSESGAMWSEGIGKVWFGEEQPSGDAYMCWYDGANLFALQDGQWSEVTTLAGNVNNRITSLIRQDVDSVTTEVVNARGSGISLSDRLSNTDALIANNAFWKNDDGSQYVATFQQKASGDGSSLALVAYKTDGSGNVDQSMEIQGASFVVGADSDGKNYINFKADNVNLTADQLEVIANNVDLTGYVKFESLSSPGATKIDGANITTGKIAAEHIKVDDLIALGAEIGGFTIDNNSIRRTKETYWDGNDGVYLGTEGIGLGGGNFYVTNTGTFHAALGDIAGWKIESDNLYGETDVVSVLQPLSVSSCTGSDSGNPSGASTTITYGDGTYYYMWYELPSGSTKATIKCDLLSANSVEYISAVSMTTGTNSSGKMTVRFSSRDSVFAPCANNLTVAIASSTKYLVFRFNAGLNTNSESFDIALIGKVTKKTGLYTGHNKDKASLISTSDTSPIRLYVGDGDDNVFAVLADGTTYSNAMNAKGMFQTFDDMAIPTYPVCYMNSLGTNVLCQSSGSCTWTHGDNNALPSGVLASDNLYVGWNLALEGYSNPKLVARPVLYSKKYNKWYRSGQSVTLASISNPTDLWGSAVATVSEGEPDTNSYAESSMGGAWNATDTSYKLN